VAHASAFALDDAAKPDIKVQQELLRRSTIQSTRNVYTQAISEQKRAANSAVAGMVFDREAPGKQVPG